MGQRSNYAAVKDAQILLRKEECALGTGQSIKNAAVKDAQIMLGLVSNYAAVRDVRIKLETVEEGCALSMVQRSNYAAEKDAQIKQYVGECAQGTGHIEIHSMNLLLLDQNSRRLPQLKSYPISVLLLEVPSENKKEVAFLERWLSSVKKSLRSEILLSFVAAW